MRDLCINYMYFCSLLTKKGIGHHKTGIYLHEKTAHAKYHPQKVHIFWCRIICRLVRYWLVSKYFVWSSGIVFRRRNGATSRHFDRMYRLKRSSVPCGITSMADGPSFPGLARLQLGVEAKLINNFTCTQDYARGKLERCTKKDHGVFAVYLSPICLLFSSYPWLDRSWQELWDSRRQMV